MLAGNIANMDVPGYQVRDLSVDTFQDRLRNAIQARHEQHEPISPGLMRKSPEHEMRQVKDSLKHILYHDGSNVSVEHQVTEVSKNQFMHNLAISIMSSQFRLLEAAISERV